MQRVDAAINADIGRQRIEFGWRTVTATEEALRLGAGGLDEARLARAIAQSVELLRLPRTPTPAEVFSRDFLPAREAREMGPPRV
jgi:NitT/TauT family transport system substrate-binding protein